MSRKFILAPDSFKGTMNAVEICDIMQAAIRVHLPDAEIKRLPMADGGEGMVEAYRQILGGQSVTAVVSDPFGAPIEAAYCLLPDGKAVMEMASCAGLPLVEGRRDPLTASTRGVGELLLHAARAGTREVLMGIGGSATNDCGIGMAAALGYAFLDEQGHELEPLAKNMSLVRHIRKPDALPDIRVQAACDVDNLLCGPKGATYVYGPQKGVEGEMLVSLDAGLENIAKVIQADLGVNVASMTGAGAAGGLGAALVAFCGGTLKPGIELLLDAAGFDEMLCGADAVFTGEGRMDFQSAFGKVPAGIAARAKAKSVPCIALCGALGEGADALYARGVTAMFSAVRGACDFEDIKKSCREDLRQLTDAVIRLMYFA